MEPGHTRAATREDKDNPNRYIEPGLGYCGLVGREEFSADE
jgi:hypothetical protein